MYGGSMRTSEGERKRRLDKRQEEKEREERRRKSRRSRGKRNAKSVRNGAAVDLALEAVDSPPKVVEEAGVDEGFVLIRTNSSTSPLSPSVEEDYDNLGDCEWPLEGLGDFVVINGNGVPMASVSLPIGGAVVDAESLKGVATTCMERLSAVPVDKGQERG
jgi:hypothetical protein